MPTLTEQFDALRPVVVAADKVIADEQSHAASERKLRIAAESTVATLTKQLTDAGHTPVQPPVVVPPVVTPPATSRVAALPTITASLATVTTPLDVKSSMSPWDGGGKIYSSLTIWEGVTAKNFRINGRLTIHGGAKGASVADVEFVEGSPDGLYADGANVKGDRLSYSLVLGYGFFLTACKGFTFTDVTFKPTVDKRDAGSKNESLLRWVGASGTFRRLFIRANVGKATGRGNTYPEGVHYVDSDIEAPGNAGHGPGNPLGGTDGPEGYGIKEFVVGNGMWYGDNAQMEKPRAAVAAAIAAGERDRVKLAQIAAKTIVDDKGKPCPASGDDFAKTITLRDAEMVFTGYATHVNTRLKLLGLNPEAGSTVEFDAACALELGTLFASYKPDYPESGWTMPGDNTRTKPRILLHGTSVSVSGAASHAAAATVLAGSDFLLNGAAAKYPGATIR